MRNVNYANIPYIKKRYLPFDNRLTNQLSFWSCKQFPNRNRDRLIVLTRDLTREWIIDRPSNPKSHRIRTSKESKHMYQHQSVSQNDPQHETLAGNPMKHGKPVSQELKPCGRTTCASEIQTRNTGPEIFQNFTTSGEQPIVDSSLDLYIRFIQ